jgi:hypothetical protein
VRQQPVGATCDSAANWRRRHCGDDRPHQDRSQDGYENCDGGEIFPLWSEWYGRFRDTVRDWWRSHEALLPDFASRMCASADIYDRPHEVVRTLVLSLRQSNGVIM